MGSSQPPDNEVGTGTFPLFVVWLVMLVGLIVLYAVIGAIHE